MNDFDRIRCFLRHWPTEDLRALGMKAQSQELREAIAQELETRICVEAFAAAEALPCW